MEAIQFKKLGWCTVGGRIEDFADIVKTKGFIAAEKEIEKQYIRENYACVIRGLEVYMVYGASAYYSNNLSEVKHPENQMYFFTLDQAIQVAKEECKDGYAQAYLRAIPEAIEYGDGEAVKALKIQLLYVLNNMKYWRGQTAREVKRVLKQYVN